MTDTAKIASSLRSAVSSFESDREGAAIGSLRHAESLFADPAGMDGAQVAVRAAIKAYGQGNDGDACSWARAALARIAA